MFNPLVSLWDTWVADRRRFTPGSAAGRALARIDSAAFRAADLVVADTEQSAAFFADLAHMPAERFAVCLVGAEERVFHPGWSPESDFLFVGKLIPLHGLETILAAARLVPDLRITVAGRDSSTRCSKRARQTSSGFPGSSTTGSEMPTAAASAPSGSSARPRRRRG